MSSKPNSKELELGRGIDSDVSLVATGVVVFLAAVLLWKARAREGGEANERQGPLRGSSQCLSPTCMRCHGEEAVKAYVIQRYREYLSNTTEEKEGLEEDKDTPLDVDLESIPNGYPRVVNLVESINRKDEILSIVYRESGYDIELPAMEPHIWYVTGLKRAPVWHPADLQFAGLNSNFAAEAPRVFRAVQAEFECVSRGETGWGTNTIPTGRWRVFPLYNQGVKVEENAVRCPETSRFLESLAAFMKGSVFGHAMFSSLEPRSTIEPHTGPCNFRLRCHLALQTPPVGCNMRVGERTISWETGKLLVFDDSYVHTVEYSNQSTDVTKERVTKQRVLLIFDVWHPEVTNEERKALEFIFAS